MARPVGSTCAVHGRMLTGWSELLFQNTSQQTQSRGAGRKPSERVGIDLSLLGAVIGLCTT